MRRTSWLAGITATTAAVFGQGAMQREVTFPQPASFAFPRFALALDLDGDTLAVSSAVPSDSAFGRVFVFGRESGSWSELQSLGAALIGASGPDEAYTNTVALDGDRLAVGVPLNGGVRIYRRVGGSYGLEQTLAGSSAARFGGSVALQGDRLAVGSWGDDGSGSDAGAVFVFDRTAGSWTATQTLRPPAGLDQRRSGWSVALDGDTIATAERGGSVRVFELAGGTWTETAELTPAAANCLDVALDGDTLIAGAIGASGTARVWRRSGSTWTVEQTLNHPYPSFGISVDVQDDQCIVGAPEGPFPHYGNGSVFRYVRSGSTWIGTGPVSGTSPLDQLGHCVAIDGVSIAAGAPGADDAGRSDRGEAIVYRLLGTLGEEVCSGAAPAPCPCANTTDATFDEGCRNSTGHGAFLQLFGSASVAADELFGRVNQVRTGSSVLLFQGSTTTAGSGAPFHDGVQCAGGTLRRLRIAQANPEGVATIGPGLATTGAWASGQTIVLQAWHRDGFGPCGSGSNLSQGVLVVLAP